VLCLIGDPEDLSSAYVQWLAERRDAEVEMLAEHRLGLDWSVRTQAGGGGSITVGARTIDFDAVDGAFVRFNPRPPGAEEIALDPEASAVLALERRYGLHWWLDHAPFPVVNRPAAGRSNGSKPYQMRRLTASGFAVPGWFVTNDAARAERFLGACPDGAVYKACSGLRSHVRRAGPELLDRLAAGTAPVLIQRFVPGGDVRVHVVAGRTFATEVRSTAVDYRFDDEAAADYAPASPPPELLTCCAAFAAAEGLSLAGLDFRLDGDGRWWCLESNPVPTFLPYEAGAGHPIGDAVLDLLLGVRDAPRVSPLSGLVG
jgi:hypothetical protein